MGRIRVLFVPLMAVLLLAAVACTGGLNDPEATSTATPEQGQGIPPGTPARVSGQPPTVERPSPAGGATLGAGQDGPAATRTAGTPVGFSPVNLPQRPVTFTVTTPPNTPENAPAFLVIVDLIGGTAQRIQMKKLDARTYEAQADVQANSVVRYTYDRFVEKDVCCISNLTREAMGEQFNMQYRLLLVEPGLDRVNDTVATWADLRAPHPEGTITGTVTSADFGVPVLDANVSVSGVHVGTRVDGTFSVSGLPPGEHTVLVHSDSGDFLPVQKTVTLTADSTPSVDFEVTPAQLVPVTFNVQLPENTPEGAWVKLAGNLRTLGARVAHPARPLTPDDLFTPLIERNGDTATGSFLLPQGAFIEYFYTIGPIGVVGDRAEQGRWVYRSFIVGEGGDQRTDRVKFWNNGGWPLITLKVFPPPGTPDDVPIALNMGPSSWMEPAGDGSRTTVLGSYPPGATITYRYVLGDSSNGLDASEGTDAQDNGSRTLTVPEKDSVVTDTVTRWLGQPDPLARVNGGSLTVTFRLSVPPETPVNSRILLTGDRPALGSGVEMKPLDTNPWLYEAEVTFGHDGTLNYSFKLQGAGLESFTRRVETDFDGQVVNDWVVAWPGLAPSVKGRADFVRGYYTPDFFSREFIDLSKTTYDRIAGHEGSAVVVSSVWSYGQTQPVPTLEYRSVLAGSVATPLEDAVEQARIAHGAGLDVFFGPQFNMEQAPGGFELYNRPKSDEWWTEWLKLADEMWTWQATVAEMIDAEYLLLPGPLFHVFDQIDKPPGDPFIANFDASVAALVNKVRGLYSGQIIISGGNKTYDFPGLADYVGVTTYDIGEPDLPAGATVAELVDYYEERFVERVDSISERWGRPVFFYTLHAPSGPTADDPSGQVSQANRIEALFQVIATRPEIAASLSWSYDMIDAPLIVQDGVRGRTAEAVLAKWYGILARKN